MDVKKIPEDVQSLISASAKVNNYRRVVEELVYNSLDAESTSIAIRIHIGKNWIQVVDNGTGIKAADYKLLGERYATSKLFDINTLKAVPSKYGYQGEALANIIEVSKSVKVTSKCADSCDTWVKIFLEGKTERECFKAPMRPSKGTTVEINGFLYNLNIQKKCVNAFNELQDIKTFLEQLLLIFNNVSISLRDDSENEIIFKMHKHKDIYQRLKSLFNIDAKDFQELQVEKNEYKVKAFIGVDKKEIKNVHWIYLNNKFVNASNLHKIINQKFGKPNGMKHCKVKTKGIHNEEYSVLCDFAPFYFIFITCPYYEYNFVNASKQTIIEFKNWVQINNIIGKLIKFYNGDINLINVEKIDQKQVSPKLIDTRDEVKKIMQKFLGKPNKVARVSQMQNGVKGKQIRRKRKKQKLNVTLTKIIPHKSISPNKNLNNLHNVKLYKNKFTKNITNSNQFKTVEFKYHGPNKQLKSEKKGFTKSNDKIKNHKISKSSLKCKCKKKYGNLIEMFKNETNSIKIRCNKLSRDIKDYFNIKDYEKVKDISRAQPKYKSSAMKTKLPDVLESKQFRRKTVIEQIKSYDLLQTVISTQQQGFYNQEAIKKDTLVQKSNVQQQTYSKEYCYAPKLTYESHHYNNDSFIVEKKLRPHVQFISNQSRENFNRGVDKPKKNIQINASRFTKGHDLFNVKSEKKRDMCKFNKLLNRYTEDGLEAPFSVDMSDSNVIEVSKQIRNQMMNDMNSLFNNRDCDKINSPKSQLNFGINLNIERTFTILVDSFYNSSQAQAMNVPTKRKTFIDETVSYTNVRYHDTFHSNHAFKTSNDVFESESLRTSELDGVEPLDVCEAILNSSNNAKDDLNNTFNIIIPSQNSTLNVKEYQNSNNILRECGVQESQIDFSKTKTSPPKNSATLAMKQNVENKETVKVVKELCDHNTTYRNDKIYEINTVPDNAIFNFKLNGRYRFVPKGMSQIFKNGHLKNISYNLGTEYYENTIYNNFVEDVAINSKIYEPKLQNLKEYATENLQKATEKLKKHSADLIFGIDSLRSAKVVLGQVDCKFIAAIVQDVSETHKSPEFLVCFDQHAVHERIRLEKNLSYYINGNNWKKITIDTISLKCSKDEILYLHNHKDKFIRFGLDWTILNNSEILVNAIPEAIRGKNSRPMEIIMKAVQDLIFEQMYIIKTLKGNVSLYPQSMMKLIFSEACRYAIKFGDNLSREDCINLIAELADCKTPFQCAHGRPVMAVIVELKNERFEYKASMDKIKQFKNRTKK